MEKGVAESEVNIRLQNGVVCFPYFVLGRFFDISSNVLLVS